MLTLAQTQAAPGGAQLLAFPGISLRAALTPSLKQHRLPERLIEAFVREASALGPCGIDQALAQVLEARIARAPLDLAKTSRIFLIGPSGAGKSSVAAKLAHTAMASGHQVKIVDSQGFNPRNLKARTAFSCADARRHVATIGVVSALADAEEVSEIITGFRLKRVIVTGLDMASRFGTLVAAITQGARLAHVTRSPKNDAPLENLRPGELAEMLLA